jgi:hypothetical protein
MPLSRRDWADAYAEQSSSDFNVYRLLFTSPDIPICHRLHYLQMASEKIAKAYQFRDLTSSQSKLTTSHVAFSRFIEGFLSSPQIRNEYQGRDAQLKRFKQSARNLAREIERLAPAVDSEHSPCNSEYPWESGGAIVIPCKYAYPNLALLRDPTGANFLRLLQLAIDNYERIEIR